MLKRVFDAEKDNDIIWELEFERTIEGCWMTNGIMNVKCSEKTKEIKSKDNLKCNSGMVCKRIAKEEKRSKEKCCVNVKMRI